MAKLLKLRRGTTSQHSSFTGAEGECTVDTTKDTLVVHDGSQAGGRPLLREDLNNIGTGVVTHAMLANDCVDGDNIGNDVINSEHYAAGSIDHEHLAGDCVDGDNIANDSINSEHYVDASIDHAHLANDCVDGDNIADDAINSEHYVNASIDHAHLANDCVDADNIADNAINSEHYVDGSIDHEHLNGDCVDGDNIANNAIGSEHLSNDCVGTSEIADDAVTNAQIAGGSVDNGKLASDAVETAKILNNAVTFAKMQDISANHLIGKGSGDGDPTQLNGAEVRTLINVANGANNYSHPNHSGEVTSSGDGATTIADNVVDEANLKVDNSPTDDHVLTAKSSASGGLTWAAAGGSGKLKQVVTAQSQGNFTEPNGIYKHASAYDVTITPTASDSTIIITWSGVVRAYDNNGQEGHALIGLSRDDGVSWLAQNYNRCKTWNTDGILNDITTTIQYIESAMSTNARTYEIWAKREEGDTLEINPFSAGNGNTSSMVVMEVGA